jgi:hypothetical protein
MGPNVEASLDPSSLDAIAFEGSFTSGYMVLYNMRGKTLDELTNLATDYWMEDGCFGGGSPRFSIAMSNGAQIHVYLGTYPSFNDCQVTPQWDSSGNIATDSSGLRWDSTQIGGPFYGTYSTAVTLANVQGLTISEIYVATDGGWSQNPGGTQTFLFKDIQINDVTRFP